MINEGHPVKNKTTDLLFIKMFPQKKKYQSISLCVKKALGMHLQLQLCSLHANQKAACMRGG